MVQKTSFFGVPFIAAVRPHGSRSSDSRVPGATAVAIARGDGFEIFTHPHHIAREPVAHVA
jgi:FdhD protein